MPAAAQATVNTTSITSWTSNDPGTPHNSPYLISYDNQPTTLAVAGTALGAVAGDRVDIVCYYGPQPVSQFIPIAANLTVTAQQTFATATGASAPLLHVPPPTRSLAGSACRLRAVPHGAESSGDYSSAFAGPQLAVSETALLPTVSGGPNDGKPYDYYVNGMTFTGFASWRAPGTPANLSANTGACGGPAAAPVDPSLDIGTFPINCAGSLLGDDLNVWGERSEVQVDGRNAYDAASAQGLFARTGGQNDGSEDLLGFPSMKINVTWDPRSGLISSQAQESWVTCNPSNAFPPNATTCLSFADSGVRLTRVTTTSDGGRVVTMTDTWSSTDGRSHSVDLLYDDFAGVTGNGDGERGWEFPGQSGFTQYTGGASVPAPSAAPGSIFTRTNVTALDGDPNQGFGAVTFGQAPAGFRFASNSELEENQALAVPAGGSASLSYVYSVGYTLAAVTGQALAAQDRFEPAVVQMAPPTTVSTPNATLTGIARAGSGVKSLVVGGQAVPVASDGSWTAQVPLSPGSNTITALLTDAAGATAQAQTVIVYQPPHPGTPPPVVKCKVPRTKGMKLAAAEKALRRAHCRVGKIKHVSSRKLHRGRVMNTSPRAGRLLRAGSKVELFVSKGP